MKLVVAGPVNRLGYGVVCANIIHGLSQAGVDVYYRPWPPEAPYLTEDDVRSLPPHTTSSVKDALSKWCAGGCDKLPHLHIWHEWLLGGPWKGPTIGMPFFETVPLRKDAVPKLKMCQAVIATSMWSYAVLSEAGARTFYIRCVGFDPSVFHPGPGMARRRQDKKRFIYLHVGKLEIRKGVDLVIHAFGAISHRYKDTDLWLLIDNPFNPKWYGSYVTMVERAKIHRGNSTRQRVYSLSARHTHAQVADLYRSVDALVQPSRGEGFGLPALEAMACGTPTAATTNTGHAEFVDQLGGVAIPSGELVDAYDGVFFDGSRSWRDVNTKDVISAMNTLYIHRPKPRSAADFTVEAGAQRLVKGLKDLGYL